MAKRSKKNIGKVHGNLNLDVTREEMMSENEHNSNKLFGKIGLIGGVVVCIALALNEFDIFVIDKLMMRIGCITAAVLLIAPFVVVSILKRRGTGVKYYMIVNVSLITTLLYSILSYHAALLLSLPLIMCMVYFDKKLLKFTSLLSVAMIIVAHVIACLLHVVVDDPMKTLNAALLFSALPCTIIFAVLDVIAFQVTNKASEMLNDTGERTDEIRRMTNGIQKVMEQTQTMMGTRSVQLLSSRLATSFSDVVTSMLKLEKAPNGILALADGDSFYSVNSAGNVQNICRDLGDYVGFEFSGTRFKFPKKSRDTSSYAEIREGFVNMFFYNNDTLTGFLVYKQDVDSDDYSFKEVVDIFCTNATSIINNTLLTFDMFRTQEQLAYSLAVISESSSQETGQHIRRVSEYAKIMGKYICESEEQLDTFCIAAMLHDIGKLMIPKEIIEKPGRLTAEEFGIMKRHVTYGRDIIGNAPGEVMEMARHIILHHHERWDGTGYLGIAGEDIDKFARYVSVCDVFDALLSRRSYKAAWPAQKVYEEITSQSGRQFDPGAVETFKKCYMEMLKIRDQFPDDEHDEENIITGSEDKSEKSESAVPLPKTEVVHKRKLPQIKVDPSIVTPISI